MPLQTVSTPPNFSLEAQGDSGVYTITPATYAPNKPGTFYLSVTSDTNFTLVAGNNSTTPP